MVLVTAGSIGTLRAVTLTVPDVIPSYVVTVLGPGRALEINGTDHVVGQSAGKAFRWDAIAGLQFISGTGTAAVDINDRGDLLVVTDDQDCPSSYLHTAVGTQVQVRAYVSATVSGIPGGHSSCERATGINDREVVGTYGPPSAGYPWPRGFRWQPSWRNFWHVNGFTVTLRVADISNDGDIVGSCINNEITHLIPCIDTITGVGRSLLPSPDYSWPPSHWWPEGGTAKAVNDHRYVVGEFQSESGRQTYLYHYGMEYEWISFNLLPSLGPDCVAEDINDLNQVVGHCSSVFDSLERHAFVWSAGTGIVDLGPGMAYGIGNTGTVVGEDDTGMAVIWRKFDVEISQGIQRLTSDHKPQEFPSRADEIPLIQGRRTMVRAFLNVGPGKLTALLINAATGETVRARNEAAFSRTANPNRDKLNDSLWFVMPSSWGTGTVTLKVRVETTSNGKTARAEASFQRTFRKANTLDVTWVPLRLHNHGNHPPGPELIYRTADPGWSTVANHLWRLLPVGEIGWLKAQPPLAITKTLDLRRDADQTLLRATVERAARKAGGASYGQPLQPGHTRPFWIGMIHPAIDTTDITAGSTFLGEGGFNESAVIVKMRTQSGSNTLWFNQAGGTLVHELGHNLNQKHVDCTSATTDEAGADPNYPWPRPNCSLAKVAKRGFYGLDVYAHLFGQTVPSIISNDPNAAIMGFPMMGYEEPYWISPWEYCKLMREAFGVSCVLPMAATAAGAGGAEGARALGRQAWSAQGGIRRSNGLLQTAGQILVTAIVTPSEQVGQIVDAALSDLWSPDPPGDKTFAPSTFGSADPISIVQLGSVGQVLDSHPVTLDDQREQDVDAFVESVPAQAGLATLQLRQGTTVLDALAASAHPPTVQVLYPNGGESLGPQSIITWSADDADGDSLTFDIFYSHDGGVNWAMLAEHHVGTSFPLAALDAALTGSDIGQVRVVAGDGLLTGHDESDGPFTVANAPPLAVITSPSSGLAVVAGEVVDLTGLAMDGEDGPIGDSGLAWLSDLDGPLGTGAELAAEQLSVGSHAISLTATDSGALSTSTSLNIRVWRPGDCNADGGIDAADVSAQVLEIFDGDGDERSAAPGGGFGGSIACDANGDQRIDAGDLSCTMLSVFDEAAVCGD